MKEPPPPRRRGAHGSKSGHFFLTRAKTNGSKLAYANRHSPIPLPTCARFPQPNNFQSPSKRIEPCFIHDGFSARGKFSPSLAPSRGNGRRERERTRDGFRSEKFFRGRGGDFRGGISLVRVGDVDDDSSADM